MSWPDAFAFSVLWVVIGFISWLGYRSGGRDE